MARTVRTKVFKFNELSTQAKQVAINNFRNNNDEVFWADENKQSMLSFAELFPIRVNNWSYGGRGEGVFFSFTGEDDIENLTGHRLAKYIWNNYRYSIYSPKQYWICDGRKNCVGKGAKHIDSKVFLYDEFTCPLTGYCMDNEIIAPLYEFMKKPTDINFKELLENCFEAWVKACNDAIEAQNSDENISEILDSNGCEFTEDGRQF